MKIMFRKYCLGENLWAIENNQGTLVVTPEEIEELVEQIKEAGF